jgi:hypothetical protein
MLPGHESQNNFSILIKTLKIGVFVAMIGLNNGNVL